MDEVLKEKISLEIAMIDSLVDKSSLLQEKCRIYEPDFVEINAIGSILHSYYNGLENIFKLIHKHFDGTPLTSSMWHSELFHSMFVATEKRTALLTDELLAPLKGYLGFRHIFRHSYGEELDWERLSKLFFGMNENWLSVKACLSRFISI